MIYAADGTVQTPLVVADAARVFNDALRKGLADSGLLAISLEDLLGVIDQPNIPGTVFEHPNWRRRLPAAISEIAAAIDVAALKAATSERTRASN